MALSAHGRTSFDRQRSGEARRLGRARANSLETWFRRRYRLAPTDPRFLAATLDDIETDFWTQRYADGGVTEDYVSDGFDLNDELARIEAEEEARAGKSGDGSTGQDGAGAGASAPAPSTNDWEDVP